MSARQEARTNCTSKLDLADASCEVSTLSERQPLPLKLLFEQRPIRLWCINAGYHVVNFAAMGAVLGAWPR